MATMNMIDCNDMLAIFVAGAVFAWDDWFTDETKESQLQPIVDSIFNSTFFVLFGAALPWQQFSQIGVLKLTGLAVLLLLFRRLPAVWFFGPLKEKKERIFAGWFGPIGVGAIFYSISSSLSLKSRNCPFIPVTCFIVMSSVLAHGITVPLFHMTMTRQLTLDLIRIDYWKNLEMEFSEIQIEREEIVEDLENC
jgi:NhaP-type Na+/H+ or K+/H+ antiporter